MFVPREGWKTITVKAPVYDYFWNEWKKRAEEYRLKHGITSFSGFITKRLFALMEEEKLFQIIDNNNEKQQVIE